MTKDPIRFQQWYQRNFGRDPEKDKDNPVYRSHRKCWQAARTFTEDEVEIATDALHEAARNRALFSDCKVNDAREFSKMLTTAALSALGGVRG